MNTYATLPFSLYHLHTHAHEVVIYGTSMLHKYKLFPKFCITGQYSQHDVSACFEFLNKAYGVNVS